MGSRTAARPASWRELPRRLSCLPTRAHSYAVIVSATQARLSRTDHGLIVDGGNLVVGESGHFGRYFTTKQLLCDVEALLDRGRADEMNDQAEQRVE